MLKVINFPQLVRLLTSLGFRQDGERGPYRRFQHDSGAEVVFTWHDGEEVRPSTLVYVRRMCIEFGIVASEEDFDRALESVD